LPCGRLKSDADKGLAERALHLRDLEIKDKIPLQAVGCERWDAQKALAASSAPALAKLGKPKPKIPACNKDVKGTAHHLHKERLRKRV
jgi:hypothetical protein